MAKADQSTIEEVKDRLVKGLHPDAVILFGSYAYGNPDPGSDLDILVVLPESSDPQYKRARECYRLLRGIGVPKDIIVLTRAEYENQQKSCSSVACLATEKGIILYERPAG